jgi:hypothetical protein
LDERKIEGWQGLILGGSFSCDCCVLFGWSSRVIGSALCHDRQQLLIAYLGHIAELIGIATNEFAAVCLPYPVKVWHLPQ